MNPNAERRIADALARVLTYPGKTHARGDNGWTACGHLVTPTTALFDLAPTCHDCRALAGRARVRGGERER